MVRHDIFSLRAWGKEETEKSAQRLSAGMSTNTPQEHVSADDEASG